MYFSGQLENPPRMPDNEEVYRSYPEVGEGKPPRTAVFYHGGVVNIIKGDSTSLYNRGFQPYPNNYLTTNHALVLTRALAVYHVNSLCESNSNNENDELLNAENDIEISKNIKCDNDEEESEKSCELDSCEESSSSDNSTKSTYKDRWTAEISHLELVESHLAILCDRLRCRGHNPRTVQKLEALQTDLPTLTQFLQFSSAMQNTRVSSVGPIGISDIWIKENANEDDEDTVIVRLRGGTDLKSSILRDAAWLWLTLLTPEILRERYMELCGVYCDDFNSTLRRVKPSSEIEELSFFNVMQDLGENFLHAFLTIVHKFVLSGSWYMDRQLHTQEGLQNLADEIGFLVDNGIIGSIFVI